MPIRQLTVSAWLQTVVHPTTKEVFSSTLQIEATGGTPTQRGRELSFEVGEYGLKVPWYGQVKYLAGLPGCCPDDMTEAGAKAVLDGVEEKLRGVFGDALAVERLG